MNKAHSPINWQNKPSVNTPINETNLNKMDSTIGILDDRIIAHDTSKLDKSTANTMVKDVTFNESTGIFTITYLNGSTKTLDTKLEKIATNFKYDYSTQTLILTLIDGTTQSIDMSALLTQYEFTDSDTIGWEVAEDGTVKAKVLDGSITEDMLQPNYLADIKVETAKSESYMNSAKTSEINASSSANLAQSYAVGGTGTRDGEDTDNAKYYSENAKPVAQTITGTNPTATNSANAPLIYGKIKGYSEQKTLSGKNLLKITNTTKTTDGITFTVNEDGNITINGTATADVNYGVTHIANITGNGNIKRKLFQLSGSYTGTVEHWAFTYDWGHGFLVPIGEEGFLNTDVTYSIFSINVSSGTVCNNLKVGFMVAEDVSEYEPFCGGIASPNPDYPQDIKGLGDSGTIEVKTCGKNLCYKNNIKVAAISDDITINNIIGGRTLSFSHTKSRISGTLINNENIYNFSYIKEYDKRGNLLKETKGQYTAVPSESSKSYAFTLSLQENTNYLVINYGNYNNDSTINTLVSDIQIEYSVVSTPYKPYTETVATIPIDTLYEGDYLEVYADGSGKIHRENGIFTANTIRAYNIANDITLLQFSIENSSNTYRIYAKCNQFIQKLVYDFTYEHFYIENDVINLFVRKDRFSNNLSSIQSEFTEYIQSNPIYFVYRLAEPVEIELTAEQVQAFKQLYTFDNVTNFFCDGEITARYYCNTDSGDTVGMIQETVDGLQKTVKEIPDTYTTQSDFDRIVGGTVRDSGLTNVSYIVPTEISDGSMSFGSYTSGTLVDALRKATNQITMFLGTLFEEGDKSVVFENNSVAGTLEVFRHKLSEGTYLLDIKVTITSITETLSGNGPSVDLTLQDIGFEDNIIAIRESECLLASYYPLIVNGSSYCLGGGMVSTENSTKGFYLRFLPHKNTKGSISSNNKSVLSGTMMIKVVEQQL